MYDSLHLLFPLLSSILFVLAAICARQATSLGISPYTATALSNGVLASIWLVIGVVSNSWLPWSAGWQAIWIAAAFIGGQLATYLAFRLGDVSLATPVFGVKIILVAIITSIMSDTGLGMPIWIAAGLATLGVAVIQIGASSNSTTKVTARRAAFSIGFALLAATLLSIFDIAVQQAGKAYGALPFLTTMFVAVGLLSITLFPWTDSLVRVKELKGVRPLLLAALLMSSQAISVTYALGQFNDATRINIVYSLRGLWSVLFAAVASRWLLRNDTTLSRSTLMYRFIGAAMVTAAIIIALC
jgi:drug/metabolite transporter (DMT)-like permease